MAAVSAVVMGLAGCSSRPHRPMEFPGGGQPPTVLDQHADGGVLTLPVGARFALALDGGGWTLDTLPRDAPVRLMASSPAVNPTVGSVKCVSTAPCSEAVTVYRAVRVGRLDLQARAPASSDGPAEQATVHVVVAPKGTAEIVSIRAIAGIPEDPALITVPIGARLLVTYPQGWSRPVQDHSYDRFFASNGVVLAQGPRPSPEGTTYAYQVTGRGDIGYVASDRARDVFGFVVDVPPHGQV